MVEIHTHGNPTIVKLLFDCLSIEGLRVANPGEFTRTAYLNNKIDLVQAEAVFNLINSQTNIGIGLSLNNLSGALSNEFISIQRGLIHSLSLVEYELDISETDNLNKTKKTVYTNLLNSTKRINTLLNTFKSARVLSDGARIVLAGKPNVGKSTLFNTLLNHERSIVTHVPGTTRDIIEAPWLVSGFSVVVVDTAGIRQTSDPAELAGVKKTRSELKTADLIIHIIDSSPIKKNIGSPKNTPVICVYNKIDLTPKKELRVLNKNKNLDLCVSAKNNTGIKELLLLIEKKIATNLPKTGGFYITTKRQEDVLLSIKEALNNLSGFKMLELEVVSFELKNAINQFNWLLGKTTPDDVLNAVFSKFCVGK